MDVPEFAAGRACLARLTLTAFAVEASCASRLPPGASAPWGAAVASGSGYTGHGSLLGVNAGGGSTFIAPGRLLLCDPSPKGQKSNLAIVEQDGEDQVT